MKETEFVPKLVNICVCCCLFMTVCGMWIVRDFRVRVLVSFSGSVFLVGKIRVCASCLIFKLGFLPLFSHCILCVGF